MAIDDDVMAELDGIVENGNTEAKSRKPRKASSKELEQNNWIADTVDATISDGYIYSGAERQTQQAEAWRRYYRSEYGNEEPSYSSYVSDLIQTKVNQVRSFITEQYYRNDSPVVRFMADGPLDKEDADRATEYVNYLFRHKLDGHRIIDETVFNAALLKFAVVRVFMKEKRSNEDVVFKYEGTQEELEETLAAFLVANDKDVQDEPYESIEEELDDDRMYVCYKWKTSDVVERYPDVDVVSPENFFISRQAESVESAKVTAIITNQRLSDLMEMYPDAPMMNGFKNTKKDKMAFWEQLQSDYQTWYSETTWFAKWSHDSLQYFEQYDNQNDDSAGLGTKELFVVDAEIYLDPDDTGHAKLCHVIKAGNWLLYKQEISERSFVVGSLIPTANRWLGIGLWDILEQEMREETTLTRAMTDAAVQAAHPNIAFDPGVYEFDDVSNRGPDTIIRVVEGAVPQQGVTPLEVIKLPGPDPSVQASIDFFRSRAEEASGSGVGIQGADAGEISDMRLDKQAAQAQMAQSTQFLNFQARNYANFLCKVMVKILHTAIKGGATPALMKIQDAYQEISPVGLKPREMFVLDVDIGVNEPAEKLNKAVGIMQAIGILTGQPDPQTGQTLGVQAELLPTAGYEIGKLLLEAHGAKDLVDKVFLKPETIEDPQVQAAIEGAVNQVTQQMQQQMQGMEEQIRQQVMLELQTAEKQAEVAIKDREVAVKERALDIEEDKAAYDLAVKDVAEERREDAEAYKAASAEKTDDIAQQKVDNDYELRDRELDIQERIAKQSVETKTTNVVSP